MIEARLAQLSPPARELVGVAATIGREFTADTLSEASGSEGGALVLGLDELWRRRIVRDRGPDTYDFTHDRTGRPPRPSGSPPTPRPSTTRL